VDDRAPASDAGAMPEAADPPLAGVVVAHHERRQDVVAEGI
jgi:hypothetical protein